MKGSRKMKKGLILLTLVLAAVFTAPTASFAQDSNSTFTGTTYIQDGYMLALNVLKTDGQIAELEFQFNAFGDNHQDAEAFKVSFTVHERWGNSSSVRKPGEYLVGKNFSFFPDPNYDDASTWCSTGRESKINWSIMSNYDDETPVPSVLVICINDIKVREDGHWLSKQYVQPLPRFEITAVKPDDLNMNGVPYEVEDVYILYTMYFDVRPDHIIYFPADLNMLCDIDGNKIFDAVDLDWAVKVFLATSPKFAGKVVPIS